MRHNPIFEFWALLIAVGLVVALVGIGALIGKFLL